METPTDGCEPDVVSPQITAPVTEKRPRNLPPEIIAEIFAHARAAAAGVHFLAIEETELPGDMRASFQWRESNRRRLVLPDQTVPAGFSLSPRYNFPRFARSSDGPVMSDTIRQVSRLGRDLGAPDPSLRLNSVGIRLDRDYDLVYLKWKWCGSGCTQQCITPECLASHNYHMAPPLQIGHSKDLSFDAESLRDLKMLRRVAIEVDLKDPMDINFRDPGIVADQLMERINWDPDTKCDSTILTSRWPGQTIDWNMPIVKLGAHFATALDSVETLYLICQRRTLWKAPVCHPDGLNEHSEEPSWTVDYLSDVDEAKLAPHLTSNYDRSERHRFACPGGVLTEIRDSFDNMWQYLEFASLLLLCWGAWKDTLRDRIGLPKTGVQVRFLRWEPMTRENLSL